LSTWRRRAQEQELDLLVGNGFHFSGTPAATVPRLPLLQRQPWDQVLDGADWVIRSIAANEWRHYVWLQLARRELLTRSGACFVEDLVHEDILWTLDVALAARRVGFCPAPLYGYRDNPVSTTRHPSERALQQRARTYLVVMQHLREQAARQAHRPALQRALLRHLNREGGHFLGLIRKRLRDPHVRGDLAQEFRDRGLCGAVFSGVADRHDFWRAVRCWVIVQRCLLQRRLAGVSARPAPSSSPGPVRSLPLQPAAAPAPLRLPPASAVRAPMANRR
jgi:hypothetical protein